jgi:hypothetical protein
MAESIARFDRSGPAGLANPRRANAHRLAERAVDLGRMVRRTVVEEHRQRRLAGRLDAAREGILHSLAVLLACHREADRGIGRRIEEQLEVHAEDLAVDHDLERLAIADPLRAGEEGLEGAAQRVLVAQAPGAPRRSAFAVLEEDARDHRLAELDPVFAPHLLAEGAEVAAPGSPGGEHGLDLREPRLVCGRGRLVVLAPLTAPDAARAASPRSYRAACRAQRRDLRARRRSIARAGSITKIRHPAL